MSVYFEEKSLSPQYSFSEMLICHGVKWNRCKSTCVPFLIFSRFPKKDEHVSIACTFIPPLLSSVTFLPRNISDHSCCVPPPHTFVVIHLASPLGGERGGTAASGGRRSFTAGPPFHSSTSGFSIAARRRKSQLRKPLRSPCRQKQTRTSS